MKKYHKKTLTAVFFAVFALCLVACGDDESNKFTNIEIMNIKKKLHGKWVHPWYGGNSSFEFDDKYCTYCDNDKYPDRYKGPYSIVKNEQGFVLIQRVEYSYNIWGEDAGQINYYDHPREYHHLILDLTSTELVIQEVYDSGNLSKEQTYYRF